MHQCTNAHLKLVSERAYTFYYFCILHFFISSTMIICAPSKKSLTFTVKSVRALNISKFNRYYSRIYCLFVNIHGETFYINFYYSIFQFREKRITLRIFVSKNTKLYNNDMKLQHSSQKILLQFILKFYIVIIKFSIFTNKNSQ